MKHGDTGHKGYQKNFAPKGIWCETVSVVYTYCEHCKQWIEINGVLGPLKFMATHDCGECDKFKASSEQA